MYLMILIVSTVYGNSISVTTTKFKSEATCLAAISKAVDMEGLRLSVKARCVKQ
jgi:hypothetical protein